MPMPELLIERIDEPIYTKVYNLKGALFKDHEVKLYAECERNYDSKGKEDYYHLRFFFDADGYGDRRHVIEVSCGDCALSQEDLDAEIMSWIKRPISEYVLEQIDRYLKKEELYEKWSEEHADD